MSNDILVRALRTIADEHPPPALPGDLWRRGRRRRHRRIAVGVLAGAAAVALAVPMVAAYRPDPAPLPPADHPPAVPSAVYSPVPFARTVFESPPGPAAVVVTGGFGDRPTAQTLVVGRDGTYRVLDPNAYDWVGRHVHLSPDGRRLALGGEIGSVIDLVTGTGNGVEVAGPFVAWSPDGRLLAHDRRSSGLQLVDLESGEVHLISTAVTENPLVAFSADGSLLALQRGATLDLIDVATGRGFRQLEIGLQRRLAGPGAWTADGKVALWELPQSCIESCTVDDTDIGRFRLTMLDPGTAGYVDRGFDQVTGAVPRLLGWRPDGTAVIVAHAPTDTALPPHPARIVGLPPGGGTVGLVDLPADVLGAEVALDLIRADRFGGPAPRYLPRLGETLYGVAVMVWPLGVAALLVLVVWRIRRPWNRRRAW